MRAEKSEKERKRNAVFTLHTTIAKYIIYLHINQAHLVRDNKYRRRIYTVACTDHVCYDDDDVDVKWRCDCANELTICIINKRKL